MTTSLIYPAYIQSIHQKRIYPGILIPTRWRLLLGGNEVHALYESVCFCLYQYLLQSAHAWASRKELDTHAYASCLQLFPKVPKSVIFHWLINELSVIIKLWWHLLYPAQRLGENHILCQALRAIIDEGCIEDKFLQPTTQSYMDFLSKRLIVNRVYWSKVGIRFYCNVSRKCLIETLRENKKELVMCLPATLLI